MQDSISVGISLPKEMILKIDSERHDIPRSRYVLRILENAFIVGDRKKGHDTGNKSGNRDLLDDSIAA